MKSFVDLNIDASKDNNYPSIGTFNGSVIDLFISHESILSKRLEICLNFKNLSSKMLISASIKLNSTKNIMCSFSGEVNPFQNRIKCHFPLSYEDMIASSIISNDLFPLIIELKENKPIKRSAQQKTKRTPRKKENSQLSILQMVTGVTDDNQSVSCNPYCGLLNQCSTCYLNVILQMFFHTPFVRNSILESSALSDPVLIALRRLFFRMLFVDKVSRTVDLTKALGWKPNEETIMRDANETFIRFFDLIQMFLPGAVHIYEGKECINSRIDPFNTVNLSIKGCKDIDDSIAKLFGEGDFNFVELPKIFVFLLQRSIYNSEKKMNWKICDRFSYKKVILVSGVEYELFQVIIHSGTPNRGHYTVYLRPTEEEKWFLFNDSKVKAVNESKVFEDSFGGKFPNGRIKMTSACMLIYFRRDSISSIFTNLDETKLHPSLFEETEKKEEIKNFETQLFVSCDDSLRLNALMSTPSVLSMQARKVFFLESNITLLDLYERIAEEYHLGINEFRVWTINSLNKLGSVIAPTLKERISSLGKAKSIYIEKLKHETKEEIKPNTVLLFVHFYFPRSSVPIQFIGNYEISLFDKLSSLEEIICKDAGYDSVYPTLAFSIGFSVEKLDENKSVADLNLCSGDLICFQLKESDKNVQTSFNLQKWSEQIKRIGNDIGFNTVEEYLNDFRQRVILTTKEETFAVDPSLSIEEILNEIADETKGVPFMFEKEIPVTKPFLPESKHRVTIEYAEPGCSLPLLYISDNALQSKRMIHIPISNEANFGELLEFLVIGGTIKEGYDYRFLAIEDNEIIAIPDMDENVTKFNQIRVEITPEQQKNVPKSMLFPILSGKVNKNGTFNVNGEPFVVLFTNGTLSEFKKQVLYSLNGKNVIVSAKIVNDTAIPLNESSVIESGDKIIVMYDN